MKRLLMLFAVVLVTVAPVLAGQVEIQGKVTLPGDAPAPGATVEVFCPSDLKATADDSGKFVMTLDPGTYGFRARQGRFVTQSNRYVEIRSDGKVMDSLNFELSPSAVVAGLVTDKSTGQPVPGVVVSIYRSAEAETNSEGIFRIEGVPMAMHTIVAKKEGFSVPNVHFSTVGQPFTQVDIELKPEGIIRGVVTNENGEPVVATVGTMSPWYDECRHAVANALGEYTLRGLDPDEKACLTAAALDYIGQYDRQVVFPSGQREVRVDFKLASAKTGTRDVAGRVIDPSGAPMSDVTIKTGWSEWDNESKSTKTGADGRFILREVTDKQTLVVAMKNGFAPAFKQVQAKVSLAQVELTMSPGHFIGGTFTDEDGKPLQGVRVRPRISNPEVYRPTMRWPYDWDSKTTTTDSGGRFQIGDLPARGVMLSGGLTGYTDSDMLAMPLEVDRTDYVFVLKHPGHVVGSVIDAKTGEPIRKFRVRQSYNSPIEVSSPEGTFDIGGSEYDTSGLMQITVEADGYLKKTLGTVSLVPRNVRDYSSLVARMTPSKPFSGTVTEAGSGKPVSGVLVTVLNNVSEQISLAQSPQFEGLLNTRTDSAGTFRIASAPDRFGAIILEKSGYGSTVVRNVDLFKPFKAQLHEGGTIKGIAVDASGAPVKAHMSLRMGGWAYDGIDVGRVQTGNDGVFSFTNLAPGEYILNESFDGETHRLHVKELRPGEDYTVDWNKPGESTLVCRVTEGGKPVSGSSVLLYPQAEPRYAALGTTAADGAVTLNVNRAGRYRAWARKGEYETPEFVEAWQWADLKPGQNRIEMALPTGRISGRVILSDGKPADDIWIRAFLKLRDGEDRFQSTYYQQHTERSWHSEKAISTDSQGRFVFTGLQDGEWIFVPCPSGANSFTIASAPVRLESGNAVEGQEIVIPRLGSAEITLLDPKTGKPARGYPVLVSEAGLPAYPEFIGASFLGPPKVKQGENGGTPFENLPPGAYRVFSTDNEDMGPEIGTVQVVAGEVTAARIRLASLPKIIFRLQETEETAGPGAYWVGYKLTRASDGKPALRDHQGPYLGNSVHLRGDCPRQGSICVPPGEYNLDLVLRREGSSASIYSKDNLWQGKLKVKATQGKYTVIDIPLKIK